MIGKREEGGEADEPAQGRAGRPPELQDALNFHVYHPLAARLARRLAATRVTPNALSAIGGLLVVAAALAYAQPGWPWSALAGLALHLCWHVVDGADGDLARLTGRSGPVGELVDGICDYAGHIVLYSVLALVLQEQLGWLAWLFATAAGISRIVQANHYEARRRQFLWWAYGVPWLRTTGPEALAGRPALKGLRVAYLTLSRPLARHACDIDAAVMLAAGDVALTAWIRAVVRCRSDRLLAGLSVLSANYRTVLLGLSMLAGSPLYYFLFEAMVLNIMLVWSAGQGRAAMRDLARTLHRSSDKTFR